MSHLSLPGVINQQASPQVVLLDRQVAKVSDANLQQSLSVDGVINKDLKLTLKQAFIKIQKHILGVFSSRNLLCRVAMSQK